jgi:UDP-2-acetamido-2-deoxy-ribo-hexuluronate aminotransferase
MLSHLQEKGIAARVYYPVPMHLQPCYKDLGYKEGSFPISEKACQSVLSLPVYPELTDEMIEYVIETVKEF